MSSVATPARASLANILVATDFSDRSHLAAQFAVMLARSSHGGAVCVAHVVPITPSNPLVSGSWPLQNAAGVNDPHERVRESVSDIDFRGVRLSFEIRAGELSAALEEITIEECSDVIVIGSSGREGLGKLVRGSAAELIMRRALCPVLVVGPRVSADSATKSHFQSVLVATDFTMGAIHALPYGIEAAKAFHALLIVLNVVEREIVTSEFGNIDFVEQAIDSARQEVQDQVPAGVGEPLVEVGVPWEMIVRTARERKASLIVMGRRPHSPTLAAHIPWTTAHQVICHAPCPVLTVR